MKLTVLQILLFSIVSCATYAQSVAINQNGQAPASSAILDVSSMDKGVLIPRMNSDQRDGLINPEDGLLIYNEETHSFWFYKSDQWVEIQGNGYTEKVNCTPVDHYINTVPNFIFEDCGVLYDDGGPLGDYSGSYDVFISEDYTQAVRQVIVESVDLALGDTLTIFDIYYDKTYVGQLAGPDTLYLPADIAINIRLDKNSNASASGFKLSWCSFSSIATENSQLNGFFYNAKKQSIGGGMQLNDNWGNGMGARNINFGNYNSSEQNNSVVLGQYSNVKELGVTIGHESSAEANSVAIGLQSTAGGFNSLAISGAKAEGTSAIGIGYNALSRGHTSTSIGYESEANGVESVAIGKQAKSDGYQSYLLGVNSNSSGDNSFLIGNEVSSICDDCILLGKEGFGAYNIGVNKSNPTKDLDVGGEARVEKLDVESDFGEIAITSFNTSLNPRLALYKSNSYALVGNITSDPQNNFIIYSPQDVYIESGTRISGPLVNATLSGNGVKDVYADALGKLIAKPIEETYLSIPPSSIVSGDEDTYPLVNTFARAMIKASNSLDETDEVVLYAPVYLPDGAEVTQVDYYYDLSLDELNIDFRLIRREVGGSNTDVICHIVGGPTPGFYHNITCQDINGSVNVIDNENYIYYIQIGEANEELPTQNTGGFNSIRIQYSK